MKPSLAIVVDALPAMGGAEKTLLAALEIYPDAPVYTLVYNPPAFAGTLLAGRRVETSFIMRMPEVLRWYRYYLPLLPLAMRRFDLSGYERVLSLSYAVAHGARTGAGQIHASYTLTPMRYAWQNTEHPALKGSVGALAGRLILSAFRRWDAGVVQRVDRLASVSRWTADNVRRAYRRDSRVIYPPVSLERFRRLTPCGDFFLAVARLAPMKRLERVVEAFNRLGLPLVVVGDGPERGRLEALAGPTVRLVGGQSDAAVAEWMGRARGLVCAAEEDFGIAMVEAQAAGCPVIALARGGAAEIVQDGETGVLYPEATAEGLADGVRRFERLEREGCFDPGKIRANAERFSKERFQKEIGEFVEK
jgi:glycosyltransferase involved in cell wall biosynthesis